jgi:hypothetical protein
MALSTGMRDYVNGHPGVKHHGSKICQVLAAGQALMPNAWGHFNVGLVH